MPGRTIHELLADLARVFPRHPVTAEMLGAYVRELADLSPDALEHAVRELIRTSEFFPTVRAIRAAAAERDLALPGEAEALAQIEARIRWAQDPRLGGPDAPEMPPVHTVVREALDHVGGWYAFRSADEPGVVVGQFLRLYRDLRARAVRDHQVGDLALEAGPQRKELEP